MKKKWVCYWFGGERTLCGKDPFGKVVSSHRPDVTCGKCLVLMDTNTERTGCPVPREEQSPEETRRIQREAVRERRMRRWCPRLFDATTGQRISSDD